MVTFIGMFRNHSRGTYQFNNKIRSSKILSRNVIWTDLMFGDVFNNQNETKRMISPIQEILKYYDPMDKNINELSLFEMMKLSIMKKIQMNIWK